MNPSFFPNGLEAWDAGQNETEPFGDGFYEGCSDV